MSARTSNKSTKPTERIMSSEPAPRGSTTWEEHYKRVQAAVESSTGFFIESNEQNIANASNVSAARNSHLSGLIDMLAVAKNALGFWGADQILMELERLNANRSKESNCSTVPQAKPPEDRPGNEPRSNESLQAPEGSEQKVAKGGKRDPMFA